MKLRATQDVGDLVTKNKLYTGSFIWIKIPIPGNPDNSELRIVVFNNKQQWSWYHPSIFVPAEN